MILQITWHVSYKTTKLEDLREKNSLEISLEECWNYHLGKMTLNNPYWVSVMLSLC